MDVMTQEMAFQRGLVKCVFLRPPHAIQEYYRAFFGSNINSFLCNQY